MGKRGRGLENSKPGKKKGHVETTGKNPPWGKSTGKNHVRKRTFTSLGVRNSGIRVLSDRLYQKERSGCIKLSKGRGKQYKNTIKLVGQKWWGEFLYWGETPTIAKGGQIYTRQRSKPKKKKKNRLAWRSQ